MSVTPRAASSMDLDGYRPYATKPAGAGARIARPRAAFPNWITTDGSSDPTRARPGLGRADRWCSAHRSKVIDRAPLPVAARVDLFADFLIATTASR
jgi:hypothetical protein